MVERRRRLVDALASDARNPDQLSNFFLYSGRTIEAVSAVAGFLEVGALLVLAF